MYENVYTHTHAHTRSKDAEQFAPNKEVPITRYFCINNWSLLIIQQFIGP
jgi:hypothetical protein